MAKVRHSMLELRSRSRLSVARFKRTSSSSSTSVSLSRHLAERDLRKRETARCLDLGGSVSDAEALRRLRCTAVEEDFSTLDLRRFSVSLPAGLQLLASFLCQAGECEWLDLPNVLLLAFDRFIRFLELCAAHPGESLAAPLDVRCVWLSLLTRPYDYLMMVHTVYGEAANCSIEGLAGQRDSAATAKLWAKTYNEAYELDELMESIVLAYAEYQDFCSASYEEMTSERPELRRRAVWERFSVGVAHVLEDRAWWKTEMERMAQFDVNVLERWRAAERGAEAGVLPLHYRNLMVMSYNKWLILVAANVLSGEQPREAVLVHPVPLSRFSELTWARLAWMTHMCTPRAYRRDTRRILGGILVQHIDGEAREKAGASGRFFGLRAPEQEERDGEAVAGEAPEGAVEAEEGEEDVQREEEEEKGEEAAVVAAAAPPPSPPVSPLREEREEDGANEDIEAIINELRQIDEGWGVLLESLLQLDDVVAPANEGRKAEQDNQEDPFVISDEDIAYTLTDDEEIALEGEASEREVSYALSDTEVMYAPSDEEEIVEAKEETEEVEGMWETDGTSSDDSYDEEFDSDVELSWGWSGEM